MTISRANSEPEDLHAAFLSAPWGAHRPTALQSFLIGLTRRTVLQRGSARRYMSNLITGMKRPLDITFRDCRFRIEGLNNLIEYGLLTRPSYNGTELDFLSEVVKNGGTAIDIGCNIGLYSLPLGKAAGPSGKILSIDANKDMIDRVTFNAAASNLNCVTPVHMAVGGETAKVDLKFRRGDVAIARVEESATGTIQMRPLQDIVEDHGITKVDALKIDIEGHEDQALAPYLRTASEAMRPRRIVIEQIAPGQDYPGCKAEFDRLGYRLIERTRNNSLYALD